ncbi:MAG: radical SAM protein, partial [Candidatus Odinarchaeia archaeon]
AIDAANSDLFDKFRGKGVGGPHKWSKYWKITKEAAEIFKGAVGVHLIVGLGETEYEMIKTIQYAQDLDVSTHLFSFYPEENSLMANYQPPPLDQYRRVQLARYIINEKIARIDEMEFNSQGKLVKINIPRAKLNKIIESGKPFMTSGCPDDEGEVACNRPYANERPSEALRNYPFYPNQEDIKLIKTQFHVEALDD